MLVDRLTSSRVVSSTAEAPALSSLVAQELRNIPAVPAPRSEGAGESARYVGEFNAESYLSKILSHPSPLQALSESSFRADDLTSFRWDGGVLGEFIPDRSVAVRKGVRWLSYEEMKPLGFNSSTVGIPNQSSARAALAVAQSLQNAVREGRSDRAEELSACVAQRAFEALSRHYAIRERDSVVLFDDNGTTALFQLLGLLRLPAGSTLVTFFDTGRVMPEALRGENPVLLPFNFKPAIDLWNNARHELANRPIGPYNLHLMHHFVDFFRSDQAICDDLLSVTADLKPTVFVIPTVTRLGRLLPFIELSRAIREEARACGYDPFIILDDCQGLGRLDLCQYLCERGGDHCAGLWQNCDAIMGTGAKVMGALMGTGFLLASRERFFARVANVAESPLSYRARRYGFLSTQEDEVRAYNSTAPGIVHGAELASLSIALQEYPNLNLMREHLEALDTQVVRELEAIPEVQVLESRTVPHVPGIIGFHLLFGALTAEALKEALAMPRGDASPYAAFPITLPALVSEPFPPYRQFLRIALDPKRLGEGGEYADRLSYVTGRIRELIEKSREREPS